MERKWQRFKRDRILGGVLGGLAWSLNVHPALPRVIALILIFGGLPVAPLPILVIVAYIAAWLLLPEMPAGDEPLTPPIIKGLYRPTGSRVLAGVCEGVAEYYRLDVSLVRVITVVLAFIGGLGIIAYVAGWLLIPNAVTDRLS
jgi:phage shock protein PspC (stress-responsive transcriptional regulator)